MAGIHDYSIGLAIDAKAMAKAIEQQQDALKKIYDKALASAVGANFSRRKMKGLEDTMSAASKEMVRQQLQLTRLNIKLQQKNLSDELKKRYAEQLKEIKARQKFLREQAQAALESAKKLAAREKEAREKRERAAGTLGRWAKGTHGAGSGLHDLLNQLGSGDLKGAASTVGKGGKAAKTALENKAARGGVGSDAAAAALKAIGKVGTALSSLGPAIAAIGAVAGALTFLVKVFLEADKLVKEMNASLLKSNVVAADLGASWMDLDDRLEEVRGSFNKMAFLSAWQVLPKEAMKIVDAYGAAGVKVSSFTDNLTTAEARQEKLRKVTEGALVYANLLGMTGEEVATKMGEYTDQLAMSLSSVREGFAGIYRVANESGYSTKKFFGMVLQATSGLSMYNVRLEQTATLLTEMTSALGLKDGFELLQKILGGMKGKSVVQGAKDITAADGGVDKARARFRTDLEYQGTVFLERLEKSSITSLFEGASSASGIKLDLSSSEGLIKSLQAMNHSEFTKLHSALLGRAQNKEAKDQVKALREMFMHAIPGLKGDAVNLSAAMGRGSPIFQLLHTMDKLTGAARLAGQNAKTIGGYGSVAAESLGMDKDFQQDFASLLEDLSAKFEGLTAKAKGMTKDQVNGLGDAGQAELIRQYGAGIRWNAETKMAEVVKGTIGHFGDVKLDDKSIQNLSDWLYANEKVLSKLTDKGDTQEVLLAKSIASNTNEATKILGAMKDGILMDIFKGLNAIISFLIGDKLGKGTKIVRRQLSDELAKRTDILRGISEAKQQVATALPGILDKGRQQELQKLLVRLENDERRATKNVDLARSAMSDLNDTIANNPDKITDQLSILGDDAKALWRVFRPAEVVVDTMLAAPGKGDFYPKSTAISTAQSLDVLKQIHDEIKKKGALTPAQGAALQNAEMARLANQMRDIHPTGGKLTSESQGDVVRGLFAGKLSDGLARELKADPDWANSLLSLEGLPPQGRAALERTQGKAGMLAPEDTSVRGGRVGSQDQSSAISANFGADMLKGASRVVNTYNNFWNGKGAINSIYKWDKATGRNK